MKKVTYYVKGMHCASCELIIEKKVLELKGVQKVEASQKADKLEIHYEGKKSSIQELNRLLGDKGYQVSEREVVAAKDGISKLNLALIAVIFVIIFFIIERTGLVGLIVIDSSSSLGVVFLFGLAAGLSSCAALVGGLVLSMSKQWNEIYQGQSTFLGRSTPHLLFNLGRLVAYGLLGGLLGAIGGVLGFSLTLSAIIVTVVSVVMILLGLNMLGVRGFEKYSFTTPKFLAKYFTNEKNFQGKYMPLILGAGTFFIPCGFTISAQGVALLSGSFFGGMLIMFFFAVGTLPVLLLIGLSSVKLMEKPHISNYFLKIAGALVIFFGFFNINSQLNVLGLPSLNNLTILAGSSDSNLATVSGGGQQFINMEASAYGYSPDYFKVQAGVPVVWAISSGNVSGCTNAVIAPGLIEGSVSLKSNDETVIEFTPSEPGLYKFSCWMGMITGVIEVVGADESVSSGYSGSGNPVYANQGSFEGLGCGGDVESCGGGCGGGCGNSGCPFAN